MGEEGRETIRTWGARHRRDAVLKTPPPCATSLTKVTESLPRGKKGGEGCSFFLKKEKTVRFLADLKKEERRTKTALPGIEGGLPGRRKGKPHEPYVFKKDLPLKH